MMFRSIKVYLNDNIISPQKEWHLLSTYKNRYIYIYILHLYLIYIHSELQWEQTEGCVACRLSPKKPSNLILKYTISKKKTNPPSKCNQQAAISQAVLIILHLFHSIPHPEKKKNPDQRRFQTADFYLPGNWNHLSHLAKVDDGSYDTFLNLPNATRKALGICH